MAQPWKDPRSGIYYIRRRVPKDVKSHLPHFGEFYKRTLETTCPREAKTRFAAAWVTSQDFFELTRHQSTEAYQPTARDAVQLAARWAKRELEEMELTGNFQKWLVRSGSDPLQTFDSFFDGGVARTLLAEDDVTTNWKAQVATSICDELQRHNLPTPEEGGTFHKQLQAAFLAKLLELSEVAYKRYHDDYDTPLSMPTEAPLSVELARCPARETKLSKVFTDWARLALDTDGDTRDVRKRIAEYSATIQRFIELFGDLPVEGIKRLTIQEFQSFLRRLPSKGEGIRSLTAHEQIAKADAMDLPRLSPQTVKNRLMALSSVLTYAVRMELIPENPVTASGITQQLAKATNKASRTAPRKAYTQAELVHIFTSPVFRSDWAPPRASFGKAWFWLPLLLCYTGARREELAQMRAREVQCSEDGVWHLNLMATPDGDGSDDRTMKTLGSHRVVPLHPDMIELGFLDYVEGLPKDGQLFPMLKANPAGWYGHNFGKRWGEYLRREAELDSPVRPSHGFRHAFKSMCREVNIPEELHDALTGHDNGSVSRKYGDRQLLTLQLEHMKRLPSIARMAGLLEAPAR